MSTTHSSIEWTGRTWNHLRGCTAVSAGCTSNVFPVNSPRVMAGYKPPRPTVRVILHEFAPTSTSTFNLSVLLPGFALFTVRPTLNVAVVGNRGNYRQVFRAIVGLVVIQMVNLLAWKQLAAQFLLGYQTMLVNIATHISKAMAGASDKYIPVGRYSAPALPEWVVVT